MHIFFSRLLCHIILPVCLCLCFAETAPVLAQTLSVFDVDASAFPTMKARFFAFGADGKPVQNGISPQDIVLRENGVNRTVTGVTCPPPMGLQPISAVLTLDISGSMAWGNGKFSNLQLAQQASSAFVRALALPPSEAAISSFNHESYINQDFTASSGALLNAIAAFQAGGGTSYMNGLLTEPTGSIPIARNGRNKRVVVFLTDGLSDGDENAVVSAAQQSNVEIYCVAVGLPAPPFIRNIARRTGGVCFENVNDFLRITQVYQAIVQLAQGRTPCEFTWRGEAVCDTRIGSITARLRTEPDSLAVSADYDVPQQAVARLSVTPFSVRFYGVPPGSVRDTVITIRAENAAFTVTNILNTGTNAAFTVTPTNFTLQAGESRQLTLRFQPRDSSLTFARFEVKTNSCSALLYAAGGFPPVPVRQPTLRITSPNGGETFLAGADTVITWEGVLPTDTVRLQYSIDSGRTWRTITDTATGLRYAWRYVPNTPSEKCLMRVMGNISQGERILNLLGHTSSVFSISFNGDGSQAITASLDSTVKIWNTNTGKEITTLRFSESAIYAYFNPSSNQIATTTAGRARKIDIWKELNGTYSLVDTIPSAHLMCYSSDGQYLAVADPVSHRIRLFDTKTLRSLGTILSNSTEISYQMAFNATGNIIASSNRDYIRFWNTNSFQEINTLRNPNGQSMILFSISHDDKKIVVSDGSNAQVIDIASQGIICDINTDKIHSMVFNQSGTEVLIGTLGYGASIWNTDTGDSIKRYLFLGTQNSFRSNVFSVAYSPDMRKIAMAGESPVGAAAQIITLPSYAQVSTSASVWSIVAPQLAVSTNSTTLIDMGAALVGAQKDSVVQAFVVNSTPYPVRVDSIRFEGAEAGEFSLVSGVPPFTVAAGASQAVEFRFSPRAAGLRRATIVLVTQSQTVRTAIQGTGIQPSLTQSARLLDFGRVLVGGAKDTTLTAILRNTGTVPLTLSLPRLGLPDTAQFSVQSFGAVGASGIASTFTLRPGDSAAITLRFAPTRLGRTSGQVQFRYTAQGASQGASGSFTPLTLNLFGEGVMLPLTARPLIDMGSVVVSSFKDSTVQAFITNPNAQAVSLDAVRFENPQSLSQAQDFSCQTVLPLRIPANSTVALTFRFRPSAAGARTAQMVIGAETQTLRSVIQGNGTELRSATLQAPIVTGRVGQIVQVPIFLRRRMGTIPNGTTISGNLEFAATLLRPQQLTPLGTVNGLVRSVPLTLTVSSPDEDVPLSTLSLRAGLSSQRSTPLTFTNFLPSLPISLTAQNGSFTLTDAPLIAFVDNDVSLFRAVEIAPNPATTGFALHIATRIATASAAEISISIHNALGTTVFSRTMAETLGEHTEEFTVSGLQAGVYLVRIQAASEVITRRVVVMP